MFCLPVHYFFICPLLLLCHLLSFNFYYCILRSKFFNLVPLYLFLSLPRLFFLFALSMFLVAHWSIFFLWWKKNYHQIILTFLSFQCWHLLTAHFHSVWVFPGSFYHKWFFMKTDFLEYVITLSILFNIVLAAFLWRLWQKGDEVLSCCCSWGSKSRFPLRLHSHPYYCCTGVEFWFPINLLKYLCGWK